MKYFKLCIILLALTGLLNAQPAKVVTGVFSSGYARSEGGSKKLEVICCLPFTGISKSVENIAEIGFLFKEAKISSTTDVVDPSITLSIDGVYPNPVTDKATIRFTNNTGSVVNFQLTDLNGNVKQEMNNLEASSSVNSFDLSMGNLTSGTYLLKLVSGSEIVITKIIKI
jgi:hypothetical protein